MPKDFSISLKKSKRNPFFLLLLILFFLPISGISAESATGTYLSMEVYFDRTEIFISESFLLTIVVIREVGESYSLDGLSLAEQRIAIVPESSSTTFLTPTIQKETFRYILKPSSPGGFLFPPLDLISGNRHIVSKAIYLDVYKNGTTFGLTTDSLTELSKKPLFLKWFPWMLALLLFLFSFRGFLLRKKLRPQTTNTTVDASKLNLDDLFKEFRAILKDLKLLKTPQEIKEFYYRMSFNLRDYIDRVYLLELVENTPQEIRQIFITSNQLEDSIERKLVVFLEFCDIVKYSTFYPGLEKVEQDVDAFKTLFKAVAKQKLDI